MLPVGMTVVSISDAATEGTGADVKCGTIELDVIKTVALAAALQRVVRILAMKTWLSQSKYDLNEWPRLIELGLSHVEGHFNMIVIMSGNVEFQAGCAELK